MSVLAADFMRNPSMRVSEMCNSCSRYENIRRAGRAASARPRERPFPRFGVPRRQRRAGHRLVRKCASLAVSGRRRKSRFSSSTGTAGSAGGGSSDGERSRAGAWNTPRRRRRERAFPEISPEDFRRSVQLVLPDGTVFDGAEAVFALALLCAAAPLAPGGLPECPGTRGRRGVRLRHHRAASHGGFGRHERPVGKKRRAPELPPFERALPAAPRPLLPRGIPLALGPGGRAHRFPRDHARREFPRGRAVAAGRRAVDGPADPLPGWSAERRIPPLPLRRRDARRSPRDRRPSSGARAPALLDLLSLALERRPAVPRLPVGPAPSRDRVPRDLARARPPPARRRGARASRRWCGHSLCWLLFRLMFSSGFVKLASGDPNWRNLSALTFHYWTQPLPPWTAWFVSHAPISFQKLSCVVMFAVELGAPFLHPCPAAIEARRLLGDGRAPGDHRGDRQLRVLQSPDRRALRPPPG